MGVSRRLPNSVPTWPIWTSTFGAENSILDTKFGIDSDDVLLSDDDIKGLIDDYLRAASMAVDLGYQFVDIKHCHGYLGHEFLSAFTRPGPYGGSFENRTRFLREIVEGIRSEHPSPRSGRFRPGGGAPAAVVRQDVEGQVGPSREAPINRNDAKKGSMKFTEKHIEFAHVCARLEISGQNTKKMALECGGTHSTFYKLAQR